MHKHQHQHYHSSFLLLLLFLLVILFPFSSQAFFLSSSSSSTHRFPSSSSSPTIFHHCSAPSSTLHCHHHHHHRSRHCNLQMRDASMVRDFEVGDRVRVTPGVILDGTNYGNLEGVVTSTWEKCEVDPHCCCAELGTEGPIRVDFLAAEQVKTLAAAAAAAAEGAGGGGSADTATANSSLLGGKENDYNFFNEEELVKI